MLDARELLEKVERLKLILVPRETGGRSEENVGGSRIVTM
jgi:hypothetical protein